ncbi:hypothetical protein [Haloplasma contractile]|uniref:Uncharacterized protein n=1 Tax=Haloplasma contractile SSD-17B TaxID=1033810 RepID=U2EEQ6_9MOLU|nr:hypothetical protein [Haloplasma contractile]ERJ13181.1 hypothetical protein HLPCO_000800 [Haloplasma contractile SSD-17B]
MLELLWLDLVLISTLSVVVISIVTVTVIIVFVTILGSYFKKQINTKCKDGHKWVTRDIKTAISDHKCISHNYRIVYCENCGIKKTNKEFR